jgi:uncharacterized protein YegJ (DUF2314 family)
MPALVVLLVHAEDEKGSPLTQAEVHAIRDKGECVMGYADVVAKLEETRGYRDVDPENCWHDWQMARREMGRKPELDPGPRFARVRSSDPEYQQTIHDAQTTLEQFRRMLPPDGSPRWNAAVKVKLVDGEHSVFMWLSRTSIVGDGFSAELFESPDAIAGFKVGDRLAIASAVVMDWMVNENGLLHGGYSLRYQRARMTVAEQADFDRHLGVQEYA